MDEETSVVFVRHRDVNDGEHHENIGLEQNDQDVEDRPAEMQESANHRAHYSGGSPKPEQHEDDLASVHVAEEPQRMRQRFRQVFNQIEEQVERPEDRI